MLKECEFTVLLSRFPPPPHSRSWRAELSASGIWLTTLLNIRTRDRPISHGHGRKRGESRSLMNGVQDFYLLFKHCLPNSRSPEPT